MPINIILLFLIPQSWLHMKVMKVRTKVAKLKTLGEANGSLALALRSTVVTGYSLGSWETEKDHSVSFQEARLRLLAGLSKIVRYSLITDRFPNVVDGAG